MTREDIMGMARQAGWSKEYLEFGDERLERFAKLVAEHERQACLKAVEQALEHQYVWYPKGYSIHANKIGDIYKHQHKRCVDAIRARGLE